MTITILKQVPGHKIPRPMNRASGPAEMVEILVHFVHMTTGAEQGRYRRAKEACRLAADDHTLYAATFGIKLQNVDTDEPIMTLGKDKFYAFNEE